MFLSQAIPLSFSIFWRLVIALPFMLIGLVLYVIVGTILELLISILFPTSAIFLAFLIIASASALPILLGARFGLQSMNVKPSNRIRTLVIPAVIYGAVQSAGMTLILALMLAIPLLLTSSEIFQLDAFKDVALRFLEPSLAIPAVAVVVAVFLSACSFRASMLVPIASASIGRDPDSLTYTPFRHFRASFGELFGLTVLSYVGSTTLYAILITLLFLSGTTETLSADAVEVRNMIYGTAAVRPVWSLIGLSVAIMLIGVWTYSLQCAGGVLGYQKLREDLAIAASKANAQLDRASTPPHLTKTGPKMSPEELRALRKSREFRDH
ncbi:hypothetical protein [Ruegeria arenilitoris]|uniref:hypothetical protein n=1 Tax=Ruegeria arenilitoris TaxID=1173585 RepID=UPI00147F86CA|nr:hypothetical protein [Ruegeria arenilitoris]